MNHRHISLLLVVTLAVLAGTVGCTKETKPAIKPEIKISSDPAEVPKPPMIEHVVTSVTSAIEPEVTDAEKREVIRKSLLNLQRLIISTEEQLLLSGGKESSTAAKDALTRKLEELGFKVIQTTSRLEFSPSETRQDEFRRNTNTNIAVLIKGEARKVDKMGNFWSFESELKGKVLNLTTHQIIGPETVLKRGKRALEELAAAQNAQEAAIDDLATYLTDRVAQKWVELCLIRQKLTITNLPKEHDAHKLRDELRAKEGIYDVVLEKWDTDSAAAQYRILCHFRALDWLEKYVRDLLEGKVQYKTAADEKEDN